MKKISVLPIGLSLNKNLNREVKGFFKTVFKNFHSELELIASQWYNNANITLDVFDQNETSFVGIFNNAIRKSFTKDSTLIEFLVGDEKLSGKYNRCDLIVKHQSNPKINFIFEAKKYEFDGKTNYDRNKMLIMYNKIIKQCERYLTKNEMPFYSEGKIYKVALIFEYVQPKYFDLISQFEESKDDLTDFYCFYSYKNYGLMVYGVAWEHII